MSLADVLAVVAVVLMVIVLAVLLLLLLRRGHGNTHALLEDILHGQEDSDTLLREEMSRGRLESQQSAQLAREDVANVVKGWGDSNERRMNELKTTVDQRLQQIQTDNAAKLELMRQTVDERLSATLEKRLGESFKQVSERLEAVHKGPGEMQSLAAGVGDLKQVLANVKTRGTWGEVQLGMLLEQTMTPEQYEKNVACKEGCAERVEFAIRLPGQSDKHGEVVWLPIDAKFPLEDYQRMLEAQEKGDLTGMEDALKALETRVKVSARDIQSKYIDPPRTTDFGIMFFPTEGLYAEVLRRPGLAETLQRDFRVLVTGPTSLTALLSSLQMGFRILTVEQRSSEVWQLLGAVKTQFGQFGGLLEKVHRKLDQASTSIEDAARKSRTIERRLRTVQELPGEAASKFLPLDTVGADLDDELVDDE